MRRREALGLVAGAALWPALGHAQGARLKRIGLLIDLTADFPQQKARLAVLLDGLRKAGWIADRTVEIKTAYGAIDPNAARALAGPLLAFEPDVILAVGGAASIVMRDATTTVPVVFALVVDPVAIGLVQSLVRPGGNVTGFSLFEASLAGKWVEILRQLSPGMTRLGVMIDPASPATASQLQAITAAVGPIGVLVTGIDLRQPEGFRAALTGLGLSAGLIVSSTALGGVHREVIVRLAAELRIPAVYPYRHQAEVGGLVSYGPNLVDEYRRAAGYLDRILRGERASDLPVQAPTRYEFLVNAKTAAALGLELPLAVLAAADEVIG
jgi:putative ABC transport system substrate-binding protein